jgi:hypothetical protein
MAVVDGSLVEIGASIVGISGRGWPAVWFRSFGCTLAHAPEATEIKRALDLSVASLAERSQIPRKKVPLIVI